MTDYGMSLPEGMELPPLRGPGNDYTFIEDRVGTVEPNLPISVVLPVYNRIDMLRRTMAMLTHQTYPLDLLEVVIADDGSSDHPEQLIDEFSSYFEVNYVREQDLGYRLSHVRNLGVRAARHDHIIILDCDMAPVPNLVRRFAEWLVLDEKLLLIGHRRYVDANDVPPSAVLDDPRTMLDLPNVETKNAVMKKSPSSDWREPIYAESNMLKESPHPFRCSSCGNVAFHRRVFDDAGPFDESFTAWGAEDNEFGYRVWNAGYYFVPLLDALGMHQEPPGGREFVDREAGKQITRPMLLDKVPGYYRTYDPQAQPSVPTVSVYIPAFNAVDTIEAAVNSALAQTYRDFEVVICDDGSTDGTSELLKEKFGEHPKVRILHQKNAGIGAASNSAIRAAKGMFLLQLDSDDILESTAIEVLLPLLEERPSVGCVYGRSWSFSDGLESRVESWHHAVFSRIRLLFSMIVHHPRMFRKRDWSRVGGFRSDFSNAVDYDFFLRLSTVADVYHANELLYNYRIHGRSTSIEKQMLQTENTEVIRSEFLESVGLGTWSAVPSTLGPRAISFQPNVAAETNFEHPEVSIVIITRNRSHLIGDAIRSSLSQTYSNFELLIVDDGSEDSTTEVVASFTDPRIRYERIEPSGIPAARNHGVRQARGEWIVIMDDDDLMLPTRVEDHLRAIRPGIDGSHGGWIDQTEEGSLEYHPGKRHGYAEVLFSGKVLLHPASMIRRDVLLNHPYNEEYAFGTDWLMNIEVAKSGHLFAHTEKYLLLRRFHGENVTTLNANQQKSTARQRWASLVESLGHETEQEFREIARSCDVFTAVPRPSLTRLKATFPYYEGLPDFSEEPTGPALVDTELAGKDLPTDSYGTELRRRWRQEQSFLYFDAETREIRFEMPAAWRLEETHDDLLRVAHYVLNSPWEEGILDGWVPSRKKGWRPGLAFSGGVDSTAAMLLMPSETALLYHKRVGIRSALNHTNAHRFLARLSEDGIPVDRIRSDHESIRLDHGKNAGFSTDLAGAVHVILMADHLQLGSVAMGMPLENSYLFHGWKGRDFLTSGYWIHHRDVLLNAGLDFFLPTAGLSEFINQTIVEESPYAEYAQSCLRSTTPGSICGTCWKCFRKNSMKGHSIRIEGEIATFLAKRPLKQAASTLYAIKRLPEHQRQLIEKQHPDLEPLLKEDYSFLDRYHPEALELTPEAYRASILTYLRERFEPMSDEETARLHSVEFRLTSD